MRETDVGQSRRRLIEQGRTRNESPVLGVGEFDPVAWLATYYELSHRRDKTAGNELNGIARDILAGLVTERNRKEVTSLSMRLLREQQPENDEDANIFRKVFKPFKSHLISSRDNLQFERVLTIVANEREKESDEPNKYLVHPDVSEKLDQRAIERIKEKAKRIELVPQPYREAANEILQVIITPQDMKRNLIQTEIDFGNTELAGLGAEFKTLTQKLEDAFAENSPAQVAACLVEHAEYLSLLDNDARLKGLRDRLAHLSTVTSVQWRKHLPKVKEQLAMINEDAHLDLCVQKLIQRNIYDADLVDRIQGAALWQTIGKRLVQLDMLEQESATQLSRQEKEALYAFVLQDMTGKKEISSILIEDIIDGKMSLDDANSFMVYDWIKTDSAWKAMQQEDFEKLDEKTKNEILKKLLYQLKVGLSMLGIPLFLLARLVQAIPKTKIPIPKIPLPKIDNPLNDLFSKMTEKFGSGKEGRGGGDGKEGDEGDGDGEGDKDEYTRGSDKGGADLDFGNPFEGGGGFGKRKIFDVKGFDDADSRIYFRMRSSATFSPRTGWREDLLLDSEQELRWLSDAVEYYNLDANAEGSLTGSIVHAGRYWLVEPYGYQYVPPRTPFVVDRSNDGSLSVPSSLQIADSTSFKAKHHYIQDERSLEQKYPFDVSQNTPGSNEQLFSSPSILPKETQQFLKKLNKSKLTKKEEAEAILAYVGDTFTYSLDPSNKPIYMAAIRKGSDALMNTVFTVKKVKCDGAGTAAIALLRSRGIHARLVGGYAIEAGEEEVRGENAHAWVEYLVDGKIYSGDPTPTVMDDYTQRMKEQGEDFSAFWEWFKRERYKENKYENDVTKANSIARQLLRGQDTKFNLTPIPGRLLTYPRGYARASAEQQAAMRQRVEHDIAVLETMGDDVRKHRMGKDEIITLFEGKHITTEREIRRALMVNNFGQMLEPALESFFNGMDVFNQEFRNHWSIHGDFLFSNIVGPELLNASNLFLSGDTSIRTSIGEFSEEYIAVLRRSIERVFQRIYPNYLPKEKRKAYATALGEQRNKYVSQITRDVFVSHDIMMLYENFIESLKLFEDKNDESD